MPEDQIGAGGEDGSGKGESGGENTPTAPAPEALSLAASSPDDLPTGTCGEIIAMLREHWRLEHERADRAEQEARSQRERVVQTESALAQARAALDEAERRHRIDLALIESETVDLESSRLLTELALRQMPEADVALAVRELKRKKPFLFRGRAHSPSAAMSPSAPHDDPALRAAAEASRDGGRGALLRYLRARRAT